MSSILWQVYVGQFVGNYLLKEFIGAGQFGGVFRAAEVLKDRELSPHVAVKLIPFDPADVDRQLREFHALNHPSILSRLGSGHCTLGNKHFLFLVTELAEESLSDRLAKGALSRDDVRTLVGCVAAGLAYMHGPPTPRVHRDLKPGNILRVGRDWKIADFGLVRDLSDPSLQATQAMGTPAYAPPEAFNGNEVAPAWDLWSLGVVIVEALTRRHPTLRSTGVEIPAMISPFQQIAQGCLIRDGSSRWTAQQVLTTLRGGPGPTPVPPPAPRTLHIGIFGTNDVGKTALFGMLSHPDCMAGELSVVFDDGETQVRLQEIRQQICERGGTVATAHGQLDNLKFTLSGRGNQWRVVTFDYAGRKARSERRDTESIQKESERLLEAVCGCDAILVLVDASAPTIDHLDALNRLRRKLLTEPAGRARAFPPIALVFTKADALGIPGADLTEAVALRMQQDRVGKTVLAIAKAFRVNETFVVSAYGRALKERVAVNIGELSPFGILEPFFWAAENASREFEVFHGEALKQLDQMVTDILSVRNVSKTQALGVINKFERKFDPTVTAHGDQTASSQALYLRQQRGRVARTYLRRTTLRTVAIVLLLVTMLTAAGAILVATARGHLRAVDAFADQNSNRSKASERADRREAFLASPWARSLLLGGGALTEQRNKLDEDRATASDYREEVESDGLLATPIADDEKLFHQISKHISGFPRLHSPKELNEKLEAARRKWFERLYNEARSAELRSRPPAEVAELYRRSATVQEFPEEWKAQASRDLVRTELRWDRADYQSLKRPLDAAAISGSFDFSGGLNRASAYLSSWRSIKRMATVVNQLQVWLNEVTQSRVPATVTVLPSSNVPKDAKVWSSWRCKNEISVETADTDSQELLAGVFSGLSLPGSPFKGHFGVEPQLTVRMSCGEHIQSASAGIGGLFLAGSSTVNMMLKNEKEADFPVRLDLLIEASDLRIKPHILPNYQE